MITARRHVAQAGLVAALCLGSFAGAQEVSGPVLTFGLATKLEGIENLELSPSSAGRTSRATTSLSFGLIDDTPLNRLNLNGSVQLQYIDRPGTTGDGFDIGDRTLGFGYLRRGANSSFSINGSYSQADIAFSNPLDMSFVDGVLVVPDDLSTISTSGIRQNYSVNARLTFGDEGPWGASLSAGVSGQTYSGTSSPLLTDNRRTSLGVGLRYNLNPATEMTLDLNRGTYQQTSGASPQISSYTLTAGLSQEQRNGSTRVSLTLKDDFGTNRYSLNFGGSLDLPAGSISASLGASYSEGGSTDLIGSLNWQQTLSRDGVIDVQFQQQINNDSTNAASLVSALSAMYRHPLTPVSDLTLDAEFLRTRQLATGGTTVTDTNLTVTYSRQLTPDWNLDLGYVQRLRDTSTSANSDSGRVFLELSRNFELRF